MRRWQIYYALWLPVGGITLLGVGFGSRKKKFEIVGLGLIGLLFLLGLASMSACSGSNRSGGPVGGTPKGTYTITVAGSASVNGGAVTHNAGAITLTVN
jgi:hypothetical protein